MYVTIELDAFTSQYIATALWAETDGQDPLDDNYEVDDISSESIQKMIADCQAFQNQTKDMIVEDVSQAGHDFWLTRNGHGAGFWDGDWPKHGEKLTEISESFGECYIYVADGEIHIEN